VQVRSDRAVSRQGRSVQVILIYFLGTQQSRMAVAVTENMNANRFTTKKTSYAN